MIARALALAFTALTAGAALCACGPRGGANLCGAIRTDEIEQALGASLQGQMEQTASTGPEINCAWSGQSPEGDARSLTLAVQRGAGKAAYDMAAEDLSSRYDRAGTLADVGEEALMAVGEADATRFTAQVVARKKDDLLVLRIEGRDPVAFEAIARAAAKAM